MRFFIALISLFILIASATPKATEPRKLALIIAIGSYDSITGWKSISSLNDINYMKPALLAQGFAENDIQILKDKDATRAGIVAAIDRLTAGAKPGDIIVFHFSGHGQQIFDDGRKDESDGYDEALVPYDANMRYGNGYTGQNHLRDDELGDRLKQLRKIIGKDGSLLVLLDACHSGTATRGQDIAVTRGADEKCEPAGYSKTISASRGTEVGGVFDDKELLSNMVVISAASADQLNYETKDADRNGVGSLSYAFCRALAQTSGPINYKILFEKIKTDIQSWKPFQNPQIEGNTDQQVLGGKYVETADIIRVDRWNNNNTIDIPRGTIHAIAKGAKFNLFPVDITDFSTAKPIASGEIIDAGMVKSTGSFTTAVPERNKAYNVVFESKSFGEMTVAVKIDVPQPDVAALLREKMKPFQYIMLDQPNSDISITAYTDPKTKQQLLQVVSTNDSVLWEKPWPASATNKLSETETEGIWQSVKQYSRAQYLRTIATASDAKVFEYVQIEFIPGTIKTINGIDSLIVSKSMPQITNAHGEIEFAEANDDETENEGFVIRIRNLQDYPIYLSVLDIMPDNAIAVIIPDPSDVNSTADDYKISSRQTFVTRPIKLYPPYGKDFMKILITKNAMDLKAIQSRSTSRGIGSSFESFYNDTFKDDQTQNSRGPKVAPVKVDEIKIVPFTYNIVKRK
ncbi:MAG: caspase family protein [Chitinophagaceae bacterium]|nr:caspase family protein [Chitinophagaceae bacterium]